MTVGEFRLIAIGLPDSSEIFARVLSAPFDDEDVEIVNIVAEGGRVLVPRRHCARDRTVRPR